MEIALIHDHYDKEHLSDVISEMKKLGAPAIRAIYLPDYNMYAALEGCHRLRAAKALGLTPKIIELDYSAISDMDVTDPALNLDIDNPGMAISELCLRATRNVTIEFTE